MVEEDAHRSLRVGLHQAARHVLEHDLRTVVTSTHEMASQKDRR